MARRRRRNGRKRTSRSDKSGRYDNESSDDDKDFKSTNLSREERRVRYERKKDFAIFGAMIIVIAGIIGGYFFVENYLGDDSSDSKDFDSYIIPTNNSPNQPDNSIYDFPEPISSSPSNTIVVMEIRDYGSIVFELYDDKVPITVANFKRYVTDGFYDGLIFHRVPQNPKVVQGGGYYTGTPLNQKQPTYDPIKLEIDNDLTHIDGALAMARMNDPDTASSQFYISVGENHFLDDAQMVQNSEGQNRGYSVFGQVISGHDIYRTINNVQVDSNDRPITDVIMNKVYVYTGT
jgi:cyclophilin family peptidyl-prolyl cis-trans isomerase